MNAKDEVCAVEKKENRRARALCVSVDKKVAVAGHDDGGMSIWDVGEEMTKEIGRPGQSSSAWSMATSVCISRGNQQILSIDLNNKAYLWSTFTGEPLKSSADGVDCARL